MTMAKDPWLMDPKPKPKTKKQTTPTPLFLQKSYLYCARLLRLRLL